MTREIRALMKSMGTVMKEYIGVRDRRLDDLQKRVEQLEARPGLKYRGVWAAGTMYRTGDAVTRDGGVWICKVAISATQRFEHEHFQLAVKAGRDGKDLR